MEITGEEKDEKPTDGDNTPHVHALRPDPDVQTCRWFDRTHDDDVRKLVDANFTQREINTELGPLYR